MPFSNLMKTDILFYIKYMTEKRDSMSFLTTSANYFANFLFFFKYVLIYI